MELSTGEELKIKYAGWGEGEELLFNRVDYSNFCHYQILKNLLVNVHVFLFKVTRTSDIC